MFSKAKGKARAETVPNLGKIIRIGGKSSESVKIRPNPRKFSRIRRKIHEFGENAPNLRNY